jgi:hypothetical protein
MAITTQVAVTRHRGMGWKIQGEWESGRGMCLWPESPRWTRGGPAWTRTLSAGTRNRWKWTHLWRSVLLSHIVGLCSLSTQTTAINLEWPNWRCPYLYKLVFHRLLTKDVPFKLQSSEKKLLLVHHLGKNSLPWKIARLTEIPKILVMSDFFGNLALIHAPNLNENLCIRMNFHKKIGWTWLFQKHAPNYFMLIFVAHFVCVTK